MNLASDIAGAAEEIAEAQAELAAENGIPSAPVELFANLPVSSFDAEEIDTLYEKVPDIAGTGHAMLHPSIFHGLDPDESVQAQAEIEAEVALLSHDDIGDDVVGAARDIAEAQAEIEAEGLRVISVPTELFVNVPIAPHDVAEEIAEAQAEIAAENEVSSIPADLIMNAPISPHDAADVAAEIAEAQVEFATEQVDHVVAVPADLIVNISATPHDILEAEMEIAAESVNDVEPNVYEVEKHDDPDTVRLQAQSDIDAAISEIDEIPLEQDIEDNLNHVTPQSAAAEIAVAACEEEEAPKALVGYLSGSSVLGEKATVNPPFDDEWHEVERPSYTPPRSATANEVAERLIENDSPVLSSRADITKKWRDWQVDFGPAFGAAGAVVTITVFPQVLFRAEKVIATDSHSQAGRGTRIVDVFVGIKSQRPAHSRSTLTAFFAPNALGNGVKWDVCQGMGLQLQVVVEFIQDCTFSMTAFGKAVIE